METRAHHVLVGAFVLGMAISLVAAVLWLTQVQFSSEFKNYVIAFEGSVTGLSEAAQVRYNGIQVGAVTDIRIDPKNIGRVLVTIQVKPDTPIRQDSVASLELQGITGLVYVEISGGSSGSPPLTARDSEPYPIIPSRRSELQNLVRSAPDLLAHTTTLTERLADILNDRNRRAISETLGNLQIASAAAAAHAETLGHAADSTNAALQDLRGLIRDADTLVQSLNHSFDGKDGIGERLSQTLASVDHLSHRLGDTTNDIDAAVKQNGPALHEFSQRALPGLTQLIADARSLVAQLNHVTAELERDPSRLLYGNTRQGYRPQ
jgi:phospholipid/cholesterol/gamma-HCH transport system substrate-binding protein